MHLRSDAGALETTHLAKRGTDCFFSSTCPLFATAATRRSAQEKLDVFARCMYGARP